MRRIVCRGGLTLALAASAAVGQSAVRDLPPSFLPGGPMETVSISISPPPGVAAAGLEDLPPAGWTIICISDGGAVDVQTGKIKWGPFFSGSIPEVVTYNIQPPISPMGGACFTGSVSFDGSNLPITGDTCITGPVPAASAWGLLALSLLILVGGTLVLRRSELWRGLQTNRV